MTKSKTRAFDAANYLDTEEDIAEYLRQVLVDNDPIELAAALGDIARAACRSWRQTLACRVRASTRVSLESVRPAATRCSR
jgi:hypothetical protein